MIITISLILRYKNYLIDEEKSEVTVEKYVRDIETFYKWTEGRKLTKSLVIEYKNKLVNEYSPATVNSVLAALNGFFAYNEWYALKVKSLKLQRQLFCQSEKELTKAEYEKLLKAARDRKNERLNLIMQTICSTGIRVSELCYVTVSAVKQGQTQVKLKGKIRIVFFTNELCKLLKKYIQEQGIEDGCVFRTRTGRPLDRHSIWKAMKSLCESAGVVSDDTTAKNIRTLKEKFEGRVRVGAGTVMTEKQVELACQAGAEFIISPDCYEKVIKKTRELGMVSIPGVCTPTEAANAYRFGADFAKLFPNSEFELSYFKALAVPLSHIKFLAVGGVNPDNMKDYLDAGAKGIGVATAIADKKAIFAGDYEEITRRARLFTSQL